MKKLLVVGAVATGATWGVLQWAARKLGWGGLTMKDEFIQTDMMQWPILAIYLSHEFLREMYLESAALQRLDQPLSEDERYVYDLLRRKYERLSGSEKQVYNWLYHRFKTNYVAS